MAAKDLKFLIGKALTEDEFKAHLLSDPEAAASAQGCTITPAQAKVIKSMKPGDWEKIESVVFDTMILTSDCIA